MAPIAFAAELALVVPFTALAASRIILTSSARNAFVSRLLFFRGTDTRTVANGFLDVSLCSTAHPKIVRAATIQTSLTVARTALIGNKLVRPFLRFLGRDGRELRSLKS